MRPLRRMLQDPGIKRTNVTTGNVCDRQENLAAQSEVPTTNPMSRRALFRACGPLLRGAEGVQAAGLLCAADRLSLQPTLPISQWPSSIGTTRHLSFWPSKKQEPSSFASSASLDLTAQEPVPIQGLPLPEGSSEALDAVTVACSSVEAAALEAARGDSIFTAAYFVDWITALHQQTGLPWCVVCVCVCV